MCAMISQQNRAGRITTTLGPDALALQRFDTTEYVDGIFTCHVDAIAQVPHVDLNDLVGTHLTVTLSSDDSGKTFFDGFVTQARWTGNIREKATLRLTLEPWFALLRHRRNQRIFHEKTVVEILEEVFAYYGALGQPTFKLDLNKSYEPLEYTVQYRESDFRFACRLMEHFGISYYFSHEEGSHTMVLTDSMTQFPKIPGARRDYLNQQDRARAKGEHFWEWHTENNMTTGAIRLTDFNFKTPVAMMEVDRADPAKYEMGDIESYDYPGHYLEAKPGLAVAKLRVAQERSRDDRHRATGDVLSLRAGMQVELSGQADASLLGKGFLCLKAMHSYVAGDVMSGGSDGGSYTGHYVLTSVDAPYAPERITPRALVQGPQTAWVVGDGEIDCDEYGRILVHFHWDIDKAYSMRCRVSQNWAGNGWGGMVIPRIGMEVMVDFIEGDPDKPLVTGCVYNGKNAVPYKLPENKTVSTFMTDTHQGEGFNELRFEDAKNKEEIFLHGQKDLNIKIENNATERVNINKVESVGNNRASETENNETNVVGGDWDVFVGPGQKGRYSPGNATENTQGISGEGYGLGTKSSARGEGNMQLTVEKGRSEDIGVNDALSVGKNKSETIGNNHTIDVGKSFTLTVADKITLKCGKSVLTMDKAGNITLNGVKVDVKANNQVSIKGDMVKLN